MNEFEDENVERVSLVDTEEEVSEEKKKKPLILIAIIAFALIAGGAAIWMLALDDKPEGVVDIEPEQRKKPPKSPPPFGQVYSLSDIIVNPSGQRRIFMVSISLEIYDLEVAKDLELREPLLRDNLITLFSSQPIEVLADIRYRQAFRARVKKIMDYQLGEDAVKRVFFDKWVFQ